VHHDRDLHLRLAGVSTASGFSRERMRTQFRIVQHLQGATSRVRVAGGVGKAVVKEIGGEEVMQQA
jgi:hypothetical protein